MIVLTMLLGWFFDSAAWGFESCINFFFFFFNHTMCESMCDILTSSAANQGDNTVSVAQGGTAWMFESCINK